MPIKCRSLLVAVGLIRSWHTNHISNSIHTSIPVSIFPPIHQNTNHSIHIDWSLFYPSGPVEPPLPAISPTERLRQMKTGLNTQKVSRHCSNDASDYEKPGLMLVWCCRCDCIRRSTHWSLVLTAATAGCYQQDNVKQFLLFNIGPTLFNHLHQQVQINLTQVRALVHVGLRVSEVATSSCGSTRRRPRWEWRRWRETSCQGWSQTCHSGPAHVQVTAEDALCLWMEGERGATTTSGKCGKRGTSWGAI